jgi:hypothetical protein
MASLGDDETLDPKGISRTELRKTRTKATTKKVVAKAQPIKKTKAHRLELQAQLGATTQSRTLRL